MSDPTATYIDAIQVGMEWLGDGAGSGVARMFHGLYTHLPDRDVTVAGLVTGSDDMTALPRSLRAFAPASSSVIHRLHHLAVCLRALVEERQPDLVAAHFPLYALPARTLPSSLPLVVHFHGPWAYESRAEGANLLSFGGKMLVERFVYARAQRFIVLSEAFRSILTERYGIPEDRIRIVPGGVDVDRFAPAHEIRTAREGLGWPLNRPIILSVRRLVRRVGLKTLLSAIPRVIQKVPDVCLLIAGKGPLAPTLQAFIDEHDLGHHVKLLGFVPDDQLPLAYRAADVSIVPTQALEGFGLVAVESLAAGTPALVTPVGGLPEVVRDLSPHLIMDGNDVEAIARHLIDVLTGSVSLPSAEACRSFAVSRYSWPVIARQVRQVYEEVV